MVKPEVESDTGGLSFEQALEKLETIVRELEDGQTGLSDSLARYEEGVKLLKDCHRELGQAERKISLLTGIAPDGTVLAESFDEASMSLEEKQLSRSQRRSQPDRPSSTGPPNEQETPGDAESESNMDRQQGLF